MAATTTFLDANIVLYAAGGPHAHRDPCIAAIRAAAAGDVRLVTDTEMLQEVLHVCVRRGRRTDGVALVRRTVALCAAVLPVTVEDVAETCSIVEAIEGLSVRDAVHAAVMRRHGIRDILTVDSDFDRVPGLRRVAPGTASPV